VETATRKANKGFNSTVGWVSPLLVGILAGSYYDLFISTDRGWNFLLFVLLFTLLYVPTFIFIRDIEERQDIRYRSKLLITIALLVTGIFGAMLYYLVVKYDRSYQGSSKLD
jgi:hypothetical protein